MAAALPPTRLLRTKRGFRRLFAGQLISSFGDWLATFAFIAAVYGLTNNSLAVAFILILRLVPPVFAAPIGGWLADRYYRRTIMVACDIIRTILIVLVPLFGLWYLFVAAFVHECVSLFFLPARDAAVPSLAAEKLELANGLILGSSYATLPLAAGFFAILPAYHHLIPLARLPHGFFRQGANSIAFYLDALSFVFSAVMIFGLQLPRQTVAKKVETMTAGIKAGITLVWRDRTLRALSYGVFVAMFGGGVLFAVGIAYVHHTLHGSDSDFGWLSALWGVGMGAGVGLLRLVNEAKQRRLFAVLIALCGGLLVVMALLPQLWLAFALAVPFGVSFAAALIIALTLVQREARDNVRGRVLGLMQMLFRIGLGAGAIIIGGLAAEVHQIHLGFTFDGNQLGMAAGGVFIMLGALAAGSARLTKLRPHKTLVA